MGADTEQRASEREWDGHLLLLHGTEPERRARLARWVRRGLEREEKVVYAEDVSAVPRQASLATVLREQGIDVDEAVLEGRLQVLPPREFYPPGAVTELARRAVAEGHRGVRLSGQAASAAYPLDQHDHEKLERSIDRLCESGLATSVLCQYDTTATTGGALRQAATAHVTGIRQRLLRTGTRGRDLVIAGEVDNSNDALLHEVLRAATETTRESVRLDLSRVSFISVAGWRALARGSERYRRRGGWLVLLAVQPGVARIARLIGVDRLTRIRMVPAEGRVVPLRYAK
ncbi:hypothetical protein AQ490_24185 [Wenjunlia vitaminophila]|uniref:STAS domain-containing protein n=1 Tax=Wenjunlia vitaminophila TaxID=76728 RepID=A0A0T6LS21_WENVI|nr:MEDS domain-containing protein [Wenjunlia vitaminophila]KRV48639.1 hypothetical protein AQ490_24185 [Wenjunlia vitaminophila]